MTTIRFTPEDHNNMKVLLSEQEAQIDSEQKQVATSSLTANEEPASVLENEKIQLVAETVKVGISQQSCEQLMHEDSQILRENELLRKTIDEASRKVEEQTELLSAANSQAQSRIKEAELEMAKAEQRANDAIKNNELLKTQVHEMQAVRDLIAKSKVDFVISKLNKLQDKISKENTRECFSGENFISDKKVCQSSTLINFFEMVYAPLFPEAKQECRLFSKIIHPPDSTETLVSYYVDVCLKNFE